MTSTQDLGCQGCTASHLDFDISMAFQPIVDVRARSIFAYEALVRGTDGASAGRHLARVNDENRYAFDQRCRVRAVEMAAALGMRTKLSINFMPNAVYEPSRCLRTTLEAARRTGFPIENIIFETTEDERVHDAEYLKQDLRHLPQGRLQDGDRRFRRRLCRAQSAGRLPARHRQARHGADPQHRHRSRAPNHRRRHGGRWHAARHQHHRRGRRKPREALVLHQLGISLMQGYLFARPGFEMLPQVDFAALVPMFQLRAGERA